jgi:hypothetical protein
MSRRDFPTGGTRLIPTEITPEMLAAGREAISRRWLEFISDEGFRLMDEVLRETFLAMLESRR